MSTVIELLSAERDRLQEREAAIRAALLKAPQGYLSKKAIRGRDYFYLQYREGATIHSQLIKKNSLTEMLDAMKRKKQLKEELRAVRAECKHLERVLAKEKRLAARKHFPAVKTSAQ